MLEGLEIRATARDIYSVIFTGEIEDDLLAIDIAATPSRRAELRAAR